MVISRDRVFWIASGCLLGAAAAWWGGPAYTGALSVCLRSAIVLWALWLAVPPRGQPVLWRHVVPLILVAVAVAALVRNPLLLLWSLPMGAIALLILAFFPPRRSKP